MVKQEAYPATPQRFQATFDGKAESLRIPDDVRPVDSYSLATAGKILKFALPRRVYDNELPGGLTPPKSTGSATAGEAPQSRLNPEKA